MKRYAKSDKEETDEAFVSHQDAIILRSVEMLSRIVSELGDATAGGQLDVMHLTNFDVNVPRRTTRRARDCQVRRDL